MGRTKSVALDTRDSPPDQVLADTPVPTAVPRTSIMPISQNAICPRCNSSMAHVPMKEFFSHVEDCAGNSELDNPPNEEESSALSSLVETPIVDQIVDPQTVGPQNVGLQVIDPQIDPQDAEPQIVDPEIVADQVVDPHEVDPHVANEPRFADPQINDPSANDALQPREVVNEAQKPDAGHQVELGEEIVAPAKDVLHTTEIVDDAQDSLTDANHQVKLAKELLNSKYGFITAYVGDENAFYESEVEEEEDEELASGVDEPLSQITSVKTSARTSPAPTSEAGDAQTTLIPNGVQSIQPSENSTNPKSSQSPAQDDQPQPSQSSEMPQVSITESVVNSKAPNILKGVLKMPKPHEPARSELVSEAVAALPNSHPVPTEPILQSDVADSVSQFPAGSKTDFDRSGSIPKSTRSGSPPGSTRAGSIPRSVPSDAVARSDCSGSVPKITPIRPSTKKTPKKEAFPKLTAMEVFEAYLSKPEEMTYEELYHKTGLVSLALQDLQSEYDKLDKETDSYDAQKKYDAKLAAEAKKEDDDKAAAKKDVILLQYHALYREEVKKPLREYNLWLEQFRADADPEKYGPEYWDIMKQIKNPEVMSKVHKRQKLLEKQREAKKPNTKLEDAPLPALRKGDEEVRKKRNMLLDPVVFEDRKTADVYMADYSKHKDAIGNQTFRNRHDAVVVEEKDENGRPKRSRGKRAYDTEQTNTPGGSDSEEAPLGKRRRTARVVQDLPTSPARHRTATREGSPKVSVFPKSGKRVGRPPKTRADALPPVPKSASKSKLQQSHLPPDSTPAESSDSEDELANAQSPRELEPIEEAELQEAAQALVQQTQAASAGPTKPKHAGGRPRKNPVLNMRSEDATLEVKASPKKGGRAIKPKALRGGRSKNAVMAPIEPAQHAEDYDVIQSTEQDDHSRFASASTSRPSTASSLMTTSTGRASRAASRAADRELSAQDAKLGDILGGLASTATKGRGGKRKRTGVENGALELTQPNARVPKKRRTTGKKQDALPEVDGEQLVTPEATGEAVAEGSNTASGRLKRKKASAFHDSVYAGLTGEVEDFTPDDESEPPPQKRRKATKAARQPRKGKAVKQETATTSEFSSEAPEDTLPKQKKHMIRFDLNRPVQAISEGVQDNTEIPQHSVPAAKQSRITKGKGKEKEIQQYTYEHTGGTSSAATGTTPRDSEVPSGAQTGDENDTKSKALPKKRKGKASSHTPNLESGAELSGHDGGGEEGGLTAAQEEARKKKQKSLKLAEATKQRWANGLMKGPMEKRAATNAAKKAAKDASKGALPNGMPPSSFTPLPFATAPPNPNVPMTFEDPPPQNPFSNPAGNDPGMYGSLNAIAYVGAPPPPPIVYGNPLNFAPPTTFVAPTTSVPPTTFVPVIVAPKTTSPRKSRAPAKKRRAPAAKATKTGNPTVASSSQSDLPTPAPRASNSASSSVTSAPAPTRGSTRVRKPSRLAMGMDGADDDEDEEEEEEDTPYQFRSEYERYQALTSPKSPLTLGKRKRKSLMDLSAMRDDDEDEDDSY
ncbi:hypothetical protein VTL71DRAFT_5513 [Oculimacula yallundae]|uniref:UBZ4-type domain-containing protein n=1 Tax=Oculimacula yallundae TaxID=86028 RepID=A0ABR4C1B5_9HELO